MNIIDALIPALLAGVITIILGAIFRVWVPSYDWDTILSLSIGVFAGNFIMYMFFNNFKF